MSTGGASFHRYVRHPADAIVAIVAIGGVVGVVVGVVLGVVLGDVVAIVVGAIAIVVLGVVVAIGGVVARIDKRGRGRVMRVPPSRAAGRVVLAGVVAMLPPADRARYGEELAGELEELAAAGPPGRAQLVYALRQAGRVWSLRAALRAPARGRSR